MKAFIIIGVCSPKNKVIPWTHFKSRFNTVSVLRWCWPVCKALQFADQTANCPTFLVAVIWTTRQLCHQEEFLHSTDKLLYGRKLKLMVFHDATQGFKQSRVELHILVGCSHILWSALSLLHIKGKAQVVTVANSFPYSRMIVPSNRNFVQRIVTNHNALWGRPWWASTAMRSPGARRPETNGFPNHHAGPTASHNPHLPEQFSCCGGVAEDSETAVQHSVMPA